MTLTEYVNKKRIEHAILLLNSTDLQIQMIAQIVTQLFHRINSAVYPADFIWMPGFLFMTKNDTAHCFLLNVFPFPRKNQLPGKILQTPGL